MKKLDHIGIAVKSIDESLKLYSGFLGYTPSAVEFIEKRGINVCLIEVNGTRIELLESAREGSEIAKFLEKKGEGLHHLAYQVDDAQSMISKAKEMGIVPLSDTANPGVHETKVVFMHPKSTFGVLTELVEHCH